MDKCICELTQNVLDSLSEYNFFSCLLLNANIYVNNDAFQHSMFFAKIFKNFFGEKYDRSDEFRKKI